MKKLGISHLKFPLSLFCPRFRKNHGSHVPTQRISRCSRRPPLYLDRAPPRFFHPIGAVSGSKAARSASQPSHRGESK
jgi:hypothetical protein